MRNLETEAKASYGASAYGFRARKFRRKRRLRRGEHIQYPVGQQETQTKKLFPQESIRV